MAFLRETGGSPQVSPDEFPEPLIELLASAQQEQITVLAGGCFWCVEAVFAPLDGVLEVTSGYTGGSAESADYKSVCGGGTDHAEAVRVRFDPARIGYGQLLKVFFSIAHDPTQRDRQGNDRGRQYRSAIFYANEAQKTVAQAYIRQLNQAGVLRAPIATVLEPLEGFYEAEAYHQNYAAQHTDQPYIAGVAAPKVDKLKQYFAAQLKEGIQETRLRTQEKSA
ncbi:MAG: peptide-methionine (S)-S-oxide reductase MsrA [Gammaproteobacteria bacterium]